MHKCFLYILVCSLLFCGCTYMRETPSYREEGRERFSPRPTVDQPPPPTEPYQTESQSFYQRKSQKLGYTLTGNENPELLREIVQWLGTPYLYGGNTHYGVDCSGFVRVVYHRVFDILLDRVTVGMAQKSHKVNRRHLREGDLVFFKIKSRRVSHVGIYISQNKFVHASSSRGVVVNDLDEPYYQKHFAFGGRVRK